MDLKHLIRENLLDFKGFNARMVNLAIRAIKCNQIQIQIYSVDRSSIPSPDKTKNSELEEKLQQDIKIPKRTLSSSLTILHPSTEVGG